MLPFIRSLVCSTAIAATSIGAPLVAQQRPVVQPISAGNTAMSLAEALLRDGRRNDAADVLGRWLAEHPTDGRAWHYLGRIHLAGAQRWHREGHSGTNDGGDLMLGLAGEAFEQSQQLLTDSGGVYRVLVALERTTIRIEDYGWEEALRHPIRADEVPLPPVLAELGRNLLASCPADGVLLTGSMVETAAVWGQRLLDGDASAGPMLVRPDLYHWDARYRVRMAEAMGVPIDLELTDALVQVSARRPLCLTPALDSITTPSMRWRPVRMVLAAGPDRIISGGDTLTVHQLGMTGLAGSVVATLSAQHAHRMERLGLAA